jgi:MFS family permease
VFAGLLGCVTAFDSPARHTFIPELVGEADLSNAVGLNSTSFNGARMIGPAIAGVVIAAVGTGWVFIVNAVSFVAVLVSLGMLRAEEIHPSGQAPGATGGLIDGLRYVWRRPDLKTILLMLFLVGTFGLNFAIYISTMAVMVFHAGADQFGLLTSMMAVGSVVGALLSARRERPRVSLLFVGALVFGIGFALAAVMPSFWLFGATLVLIGVSAQTFTTTATSAVQLSTEPAVRGRVMALLLSVALGGLSLGAPLVGWIANRFGPRSALVVASASGFAAALVGIYYLMRYPDLTLVGAVREADVLENE